jgi:hypothetical protein
MNQDKNLKNPSQSKNPVLKCRYARGLGDLLACFFHSKPIGWLTYLITGSKVPCMKCNMRRDAWNIVCPIPFWRLYFKDMKELIKNLAEDFKKNGYSAHITPDGLGIQSIKHDLPPPSNEVDKELQELQDKGIKPPEILSNNNTLSAPSPQTIRNGYDLVSSGDTVLSDFIISTQIFKKK